MADKNKYQLRLINCKEHGDFWELVYLYGDKQRWIADFAEKDDAIRFILSQEKK
jgi:hypothetical protein